MLEKDLVERCQGLIKEKRYAEIKKLFPPHPEDIASLISQLNPPSYKLFVFRLVPYKKAVEVFEYLPTEEEEEMLSSLSSQEIKDILNEMSPDDRTELFEEMPAELVKKFISLLSPQERKIAVEILNYPADSVGRLITPDFVQLYEDMTVEGALTHIRSVGLGKETIYHCYCLDSQKRLIGIVSLKKLVLASPQTKISEVMFRDVIKVNIYADKEEAANIFKKYDLIVLPVVDSNSKLLGIVTFDDLVDVLEEETTEDFEKIAAVLPVEKPYMEASFFNILWKRSVWLILLAVFGSVSGFVLQKYTDSIHQLVALTFFLPLLIATGGNAGIQSATIIIRSLAIGDIGAKDFFRVVFRESFLGLFIGIMLALVGFMRALFQLFIQGGLSQSDWLLSVSVGISMGITVVVAAIVGASLPLISRRLKVDPALMSGPLITTIVDIVGIFIYFEIAGFILNL
ncbi:MAG: magnesium transporter [Candidatus Omnitrophota bacterium]